MKNDGLLLFEAISGSHAYGLNHAKSDVDKRGIFVLSKDQFFGLNRIDQVADKMNDEVYYELEKFVLLLSKSNPTALELLCTPEESFLFKNPLFDLFKPEDFITKQCFKTFAGYAMSQIKKARGLNKKIINPVEKKRKSVLEFCYVSVGQGSMPLLTFLEKNNFDQANCGLVNVANMKDVFALFHHPNLNYQGIIKNELANEVCLSSIPKNEEPITNLYFNQNGYSTYCKEYRQYWDWVEKRNDARYENTLEHGKNYDSKNMMHTFRLLNMADEIARFGRFEVRRTEDKDFLWAIRTGEFEYEDLVKKAEVKIKKMDTLFEKSNLIESCDLEKANGLLVEIRNGFYG